MKDRNLKALISKIILFYSVFYVVMKIIAILFEGVWVVPNLILTIPYIIFAVVGYVMIKRNHYSWIYVVAGVFVISLVRYYEMDWLVGMNEYFN